MSQLSACGVAQATTDPSGRMGSLGWCPERGSNPHAPFKGPRILSPLRLPISPSGRTSRGRRRTTGQEVWRRDPESNRTRRICNPLHNRFAIAPGAYRVVRSYQERARKKKGKPRLPFLVTRKRTSLRRASGAGNEARTRDLNLGKVALYQLSYSRVVSTSADLLFVRVEPRIIGHFFSPSKVQTRSVR